MENFNETITNSLAYIHRELGKMQFNGDLVQLKMNLKDLSYRVGQALIVVNTELDCQRKRK